MKNIDLIVFEAQEAFWEVISKHFPDASGDIDVESVTSFDAASREAILTWIELNAKRP